MSDSDPLTHPARIRTVVRLAVAAVIVLHGLIHLLGVVKGFGWADVSQLQAPISTALGAMWLAAALLVIAAGVLLGLSIRWWWVVGGLAAVISQVVIMTSWSDARVGTVVNVILLVAAVHGYASHGPRSLRAEYRRRVTAAIAQPTGSGPIDTELVTEADLGRLPSPVAAYLRRCGAVGQPRVQSVRARIHGRIRGGPTKPWMPFTGEQLNTLGYTTSGAGWNRFFFIDASTFGVPIDVLHVFSGFTASMRVKLLSLVPMVNVNGPAMDRAETVTLFNDLCILAPAAIVDAPITWQEVDDRHVRGAFTLGENTVSAELFFNDRYELVDFVSDDRLAASPDGHSFIPRRWSTPVGDYRTFEMHTFEGLRIASFGEARWEDPAPGSAFAYLEYHLDEITYNVSGSTSAPAASGHLVSAVPGS